jgi:ubiquinone/menaquinone biosynthesis C-methylase UbiE
LRQGVGGEIILERFRPAELELIDIDPDMVERARRRLAGRAETRVRVGDATRIEAADASFDAVFDFGAIHQIPDWPADLSTSPGGCKCASGLTWSPVAGPRRFSP